MRIKIKKIPLYTGKLKIIQLEEKESMDIITKMYNIDFDMSCFNGMVFRDSGNYIIAFSQKNSPGIIAHESLHAVSYIYQDHIMRMDCENDEPIAYLLEWIVEECHKFLNIK